MKFIPLTQGKEAIVDDDMYEYLMQWKWSSSVRYALRRQVIHGKSIQILMHRFIVQAPDHMEVDHRNNDGLDNRKENLRQCTHAENMRNRKIQNNNTSGFKGVRWHKKDKRWISQIKFNGKQLHLGSFKDAKTAALAYDEKAIELYGEFAKTNFK